MEYMKIRKVLRDIFIVTIACAGISFVYRLWAQHHGPLVRVIVFHDVENRQWFERVVATLRSRFRILTPEEFHAGTYDPSSINVLLTFDDGYQSWIDTCLPILKKYDVKGLFFINSGILDVAEDVTRADAFTKNQLKLSPKKLLTWEGAAALVRAGHTIGGHTSNHENLATLSKEMVRNEILNDKRALESKLGITLQDFAYPFGRKWHFTPEISVQTRAAGYRYVYTAESSFVTKIAESEIPRVCLEKNQGILSIIQWVLGGYDILSRLTNYTKNDHRS